MSKQIQIFSQEYLRRRKMYRKSFTLMEVIISLGLIVTIFSLSFGYVTGSLLEVKEMRARAELSQIAKATKMMVINEGGDWPGDVNRGIPPGIEEYLGPGHWPDAPFNEVAEYDWDHFTGSDGKPVYQISIRFCPLGQPDLCQIPDYSWAENFDYHSSFYLCIEGKCRAHPSKPDDHPGYCVNCKE